MISSIRQRVLKHVETEGFDTTRKLLGMTDLGLRMWLEGDTSYDEHILYTYLYIIHSPIIYDVDTISYRALSSVFSEEFSAGVYNLVVAEYSGGLENLYRLDGELSSIKIVSDLEGFSYNKRPVLIGEEDILDRTGILKAAETEAVFVVSRRRISFAHMYAFIPGIEPDEVKKALRSVYADDILSDPLLNKVTQRIGSSYKRLEIVMEIINGRLMEGEPVTYDILINMEEREGFLL